MKSFFSIVSLILMTQFSIAQNLILVDSIPISNQAIKTIETDLNNSLYLISDTKIEKRFATKKVKSIDFKNIINNVDSSNPLRFYLYSNLSKISILDEDLNPIQDPITIPTKDFMPAAIKVVDNQFCWFYDLIGNKLVYYNYQLQKTILSSKPIFLKENDQSIEQIHFYKNILYLKSQHYIYLYDDYGNFKTNYKIDENIEVHHFYKNILFYIKNNTLYAINLDSQVLSNITDLKNSKSITMNETNFYSLGDQHIYKYQIN